MQPGRLCCFAAFTRVELLAVLAALALLAAVAWPAMAGSRESGRRVGCANNLRQIAQGWLSWAGEHGGQGPSVVDPANGGTRANQNLYVHFLVTSNEVESPRLLLCPSDARRLAASNWAEFGAPPFRNNAVSYFAGLHLGLSRLDSLIAGDSHLARVNTENCSTGVRGWAFDTRGNTPAQWRSDTLHPNVGQVAISDGRVRATTTAQFRNLFLEIRLTDDLNGNEHVLPPPQ